MRGVLFLSFLVFSFIGVPEGVLAGNEHNVVGPQKCVECHKKSGEAWQNTHHYKTFKELSRDKEARDIAKNLGIKRIRNSSTCMQCHFTAPTETGKAVAGISCESCHGAGGGYINIHGDYGGKNITAKTESPEHRKKRYHASEKAGLLRPENVHLIAQNCYGCHSVPDEKLVNIGGHKPGSKDFELLSWSQGEVRHNVWYTPDNAEPSVERKRLLYLVGKMTDMEYTLRGLAKATQKATYAKSFVFRYKRLIADLKEIERVLPLEEITSVVNISKGVGIKLNNAQPLLAAADKLRNITSLFAEKNDGSGLGAIDQLLPGKEAYKGKPAVN